MKKAEKDFELLSAYLIKMRPEEFLGLCQILCVKIYDEEKNVPRDAIDMISDVIDQFKRLSRKKRKEVLQLLTATQGGETDGNTTTANC